MLTESEVLQQSRSAYGQWAPLWRKNCAMNGEVYKAHNDRLSDLYGRGIGKRLVIVAMGASLEESIATIRANRTVVDVLCVDNALGALIDHGITPDYVVLMDAQVSWKKYGAKYAERAKSARLIMNVNGNPEWSRGWRGKVYFGVNKDNIQSEVEFSKISGVQELVPAGSNVGNGAVILATSVLDYSAIFLVGNDSSWRDTDNYYAFGDSEKRHYMSHSVAVDVEGQLTNTSTNLMFSARWLADYINLNCKTTRVINCSRGIINLLSMPLDKAIASVSVEPMTEDLSKRAMLARVRTMFATGRDHLLSIIGSENVVGIEVKYLPKEATA